VSADVAGRIGTYTVRSVSAYAWSDSVYSFDGDWGNDAYWGEFAPYDYFSRYARERSSLSQDLRLLAGEDTDRRRWLVGVYALRLEEDTLQRDSFAGDLLRPVLDSDFRATQLAPYAQFDWQVGDAVSLSAGLRLERRSADYRDSDGTTSSPVDTMLGGQLSASVDFGDSASWYSTLSRGYKAGGFNIGPLVPQDRREFEPEYLWNLESGLRHLSADASLRAELSVFYMRREQQQVASSFQLDPGDPLSYLFLVDNAARGRNYGLEGAVDWQAGGGLRLGGTLGWLESEFLDYRYGGRDLDGRAMAHAPRWQYSLYADWRSRSGPGLRADLQGMDAFYFDTSHDRRSQAYALVHLRGGYFAERWSVTAWVRNAFDADRAVRGFYFGLEPPDYADTLYVQHGDPRQVGLSFELRWP
jgi:outer membrane receptor protein involved in Fe transport